MLNVVSTARTEKFLLFVQNLSRSFNWLSFARKTVNSGAHLTSRTILLANNSWVLAKSMHARTESLACRLRLMLYICCLLRHTCAADLASVIPPLDWRMSCSICFGFLCLLPISAITALMAGAVGMKGALLLLLLCGKTFTGCSKPLK